MANNTSPTQSESVGVNLINDIEVNGVKYRKGQNVQVPRSQADDIQRIDYDHQQYKDNLLKKNVYEVNSGTMAVGQ
jgi:hypothetical protein